MLIFPDKLFEFDGLSGIAYEIPDDLYMKSRMTFI